MNFLILGPESFIFWNKRNTFFRQYKKFKADSFGKKYKKFFFREKIWGRG